MVMHSNKVSKNKYYSASQTDSHSTSPFPMPSLPLLLTVLSLLCSPLWALSLVDVPDLRQSISPSLNPCTDFYQFACDGFLRRAQPRSECSEVSNAATRKVSVQAQLESLLGEKPPSRRRRRSSANLHIRRMYLFNDLCRSWPRNALLASEVVLSRLEQLHGGRGRRPVFDTEWAVRAFPITAFFQLTTFIDVRKARSHPQRRIVGIQSKPPISGRADWAVDGVSQSLLGTRFGHIMRTLLEDDVVRAQRDGMEPVLFPATRALLEGEVATGCVLGQRCWLSARLLQMLEAESQRRVHNLLTVERILAESLGDEYDAYSGPLGSQTRLRLDQLPTAPINWQLFLPSILSPVRRVDAASEVHVSDPGLAVRLASAIARLSGDQVADYLDWQVLWAFLPQMDPRYSHTYVNITRMKDAKSVQKCPLVKRLMQIEEKCEKLLEWHFPHLLDRLYAEHHVERAAKEDIARIYDHVRAAFRGMIQTSKWLDAPARQRALAKLDALRANLLYFDQIFDDAHLDRLYQLYAALRLDQPFALVLHQLEGLSYLRRLSTNEFYETSFTVNAFYSRENNVMVALNAYLQPPIYFGASHPAALNFAGIGVVMGHELTHGFDDWGSYYDAEGRLAADWLLGPALRATFQLKKQCFVDQYSGVQVNVPGEGTMHVNGSLTSNENIADNGGIAASFYAWEAYKRVGGRGALDRVRGLEQYSGDQLFFLNYAFRNCAKLGSVWLKQRLLTGWHALSPARVNVPLRNFPRFAEVFNCPLGSPMNPEKYCKIWAEFPAKEVRRKKSSAAALQQRRRTRKLTSKRRN